MGALRGEELSRPRARALPGQSRWGKLARGRKGQVRPGRALQVATTQGDVNGVADDVVGRSPTRRRPAVAEVQQR